MNVIIMFCVVVLVWMVLVICEIGVGLCVFLMFFSDFIRLKFIDNMYRKIVSVMLWCGLFVVLVVSIVDYSIRLMIDVVNMILVVW